MNEFSIFLDLKYLILVMLGTAGLTLVSYSPREIIAAVKLAFNGSGAALPELSEGKQLWSRAARNAYLFGAFGAILKLIIFFENLNNSGSGSTGIGGIVGFHAQVIQPVIYGLILGSGLMIPAWRLQHKNPEGHSGGKLPASCPMARILPGYLVMVAAVLLVLLADAKRMPGLNGQLLAIVLGGTVIVFLITRDKFSVSAALGLLGMIMVLLGLSRIFHEMGSGRISETANAMQFSLVSLFYLLAGLLFAGIPLDDYHGRQGNKTPLLNKMIYLLIPIISTGFILIIFILIITPIAKR